MAKSSVNTGPSISSTSSIPLISARGSPTPTALFLQGRPLSSTLSSPQLQPTPPSGPPPSSAVSAPKSSLNLLEAFGLRLPTITSRKTGITPDPAKSQAPTDAAARAWREKVDALRTREAEAEADARKRIEEISRRGTHGESIMKALAEAQDFANVREEAERKIEADLKNIPDEVQGTLEQQSEGREAGEGRGKGSPGLITSIDSSLVDEKGPVPVLQTQIGARKTEAEQMVQSNGLECTNSQDHCQTGGKVRTEEELRGIVERARTQEAEARARVDRHIEAVATQPEQRLTLQQILAETERHTRERIAAEAQLKAEEEAAEKAEQETREQTKAKRMAEVRLAAESAAALLAHEEVSKAGEKGVSTESAAKAERGEIVMAMAAIDEAKRKRVEAKGKRLHAEGGVEEQVRRKREHMLAQITSERGKMQELDREAKILATKREALEARQKDEVQEAARKSTTGSNLQERMPANNAEMENLERVNNELQQGHVIFSSNLENCEELTDLGENAPKMEAEKEGVIDKQMRRQNKKEELMKKRRQMEARLKEEATKMAQLSESAKKKGESKLISEEAKREAQELVQAEALAVAELERQAAEMALQRAEMERQLEVEKKEKAAEIQATSSALKAKREEMEAKMQREEQELQSMSESAKRKVEDKMLAEANAIACMERRAAEMAAKRAELEDKVSREQKVDGTLMQESEKLEHKREEMEAKILLEEEELERLSMEARNRVAEKMVSEAAAIAEMEKQAAELAQRRAELAMAIAAQQSVLDQEEVEMVAEINQSDDVVGKLNKFDSNSGIGESDDLCKTHEQQIVAETTEPTSVRFITSSKSLYDLMAADQSNEILSNITDVAEDPGEESGDLDLAEMGTVSGEVPQLNICEECLANQGGLPPAHFAAAAGHVACLWEIQAVNPELLVLLDAAGRTPLFYSCANGHADATRLLLQEGPQCCHLVDTNQDTPLHAAALAGSVQCTRLLLQQGIAEAEPQNALQMTPAHLAANNETLEVLSQHGASLNAKDQDLRTPLFIACATDRVEKAEFLCELLDCAGQDLGESDKRGDTPMHAASCNGSTACLLLLLQYGVQPDVRNKKGLRPIDLAARRGRSACEKVLLEYQLHHHVNNSYFDSVLFLATLEGHKKCKEELSDCVPYEIIKPAAKANTSQNLDRTESVMSLRHGRSVRLKQWGDWIAYEDQDIRHVFWYNHVARTSQWEKPDGVDDREEHQNQDGDTENKQLVANASMRLRREGEWIQYTLPDGNVFYYNDTTNNFQWERPSELGPATDPAIGLGLLDEFEGKPQEDTPGDTGSWGAFKDPATGMIFWYNHETGQSQWEPPEEIVDVGEELGCVEDRKQAIEEENVRRIETVDDLFTPR